MGDSGSRQDCARWHKDSAMEKVMQLGMKTDTRVHHDYLLLKNIDSYWRPQNNTTRSSHRLAGQEKKIPAALVSGWRAQKLSFQEL